MSRYLVKLVRDQIGEMLPKSTIQYEAVGVNVLRRELRRKLMEETTEYLLNPSVDELADILEVVYALAFHDLDLGLNGMVKVWAAQNRKQDERGGFNLGIGMYAVNVEAGPS